MGQLNVDPTTSNGPSGISDFALIIVRRIKLISVILVATLSLAAGYTVLGSLLPPSVSFSPDIFSAEATLLFEDRSRSGLSSGSSAAGLAALAGFDLGGSSNDALLAVELSDTNSFLDQIIDEFGLINNSDRYPRTAARKTLRENLKVEYNSNIQTIKITFTHWEKGFVAEVVTYAIALLDQRFSVIGSNRNLTEKDLLEKKLAEVTAATASLEDKIKAFQTQYGALTLDQLVAEQVTALATARSQLILKELEITTYEQFSRVDDPVRRRMQAERQGLLSLIAEMESGSGVSGRPGFEALPQIAQEYSQLEREMRIQAEIGSLLTQQYELAKLKEEGEGPRFQVLEGPETPEKKTGPSRLLVVVFGAFAGVGLGLIASLIIETIERIRAGVSIKSAMTSTPSRYYHGQDT